MRRAIMSERVEVPVMGSFNLSDDNAVARISEASIEDALVELASDPSVDAVIDSGDCGTEPTTVVDLSGDEPEIVRRGAGDPSRFE